MLCCGSVKSQVGWGFEPSLVEGVSAYGKGLEIRCFLRSLSILINRQFCDSVSCQDFNFRLLVSSGLFSSNHVCHPK